MKKEKAFKIYGRVLEKESKKGIPGLTVEALDKDLCFDDRLGSVITDKEGNFEIIYAKEDFQELFFDQKPDIYLRIRRADGKIIHTTKDKVRYEAGRTEEFIVTIPKKLLEKEAKMKWDIKRSDEIKEKIASNKELMKELGNAIDNILKKHKVELKGMSYIFEPRVFMMDKNEVAELMMKSRAAMLMAIMEDLIEKGKGAEIESALDGIKVTGCLPQCGPLDPITLHILEKIRIIEKIELSDSNPLPPSETLIREIVGNKELLEELSKSIFSILEKHGITFKENEGCVFTPLVFETPIFAQKVGVAESIQQIRGFGPQVYADPNPQPAIKMRPWPGIIEMPKWQTVGVIIDRWWWTGIPAPEMLRALDVMRRMEHEQMKR